MIVQTAGRDDLVVTQLPGSARLGSLRVDDGIAGRERGAVGLLIGICGNGRVCPGLRCAGSGGRPRQGMRGANGDELRLQAATQHDVRAAACHIGGDGHRTRTTRLRDDVRLALVLLRVEDLMADALLLQQSGKELGSLDGGGANQHRLLPLRAVANVVDNGLELVLLRQVHEIRLILADHGSMRRYDRDFEAVNLQEFRCLGVRGTGHASELFVISGNSSET